MKSKKQLDSFTTYCNEHPEERFWQALRNWSGHACILVADGYSPSLGAYRFLEDTFFMGEDERGVLTTPKQPQEDIWESPVTTCVAAKDAIVTVPSPLHKRKSAVIGALVTVFIRKVMWEKKYVLSCVRVLATRKNPSKKEGSARLLSPPIIPPSMR